MTSVNELVSFITHPLALKHFEPQNNILLKTDPQTNLKTQQAALIHIFTESLQGLGAKSLLPRLEGRLGLQIAQFFATFLDQEGKLAGQFQPIGSEKENANLTFHTKIETEPSTSSWNFHFIPLKSGQDILPLRLYIPQQKEEDNTQDTDFQRKRFIAEFFFENWGLTQIEGLLTQNIFQISLRNYVDFGDKIKSELRDLFQKILQKSNKTGDIYFEGKEKMKKMVIIESSSDQIVLSV